MNNTPTQSKYADTQSRLRADMFLHDDKSGRSSHEGFSDEVYERFLRQSAQYLRTQSKR